MSTEDLDVALQSIMRTVLGRKWLYSVLDRCGPFRTPFAADPYVTAYKAGEQNVGLWLLAEIMRVSPDEYVTMCKEQENAGRDHHDTDN